MAKVADYQHLSVPLQPYLQDTYARRIIEDATLEHDLEAQSKQPKSPTWALKVKLVGALGVALIETITYVAMQVIARGLALMSKQVDTQVGRYSRLTRGALAAVVVAALGIRNSTYATQIPKNIEEAADKECQDAIKNSIVSLDKAIQTAYEVRLKTISEKHISEADQTPWIWEKQAAYLKKEMEQRITQLTHQYPTLKPHQKYAALETTRATTLKMKERVKDMVLTKHDAGYSKYFDYEADLVRRSVLIKLKEAAPSSSKAETFIQSVATDLDHKLQKLAKEPKETKKAAFEAFSSSMDAYIKEKLEKLKTL